MIKVKKTKASDDNSDQAQSYQFSDVSGKGGLPHAIGMAIMSIALYLRSMMSSPLAALTAEPDPADTGSHHPQHKVTMGSESYNLSPMKQEQAANAPAPAEDAPTTDFAQTYNFSHGDNVVPFVNPQDRQSKLVVASAQQQSGDTPQSTVVSRSWDNPDFSDVSFGQPVFSTATSSSSTEEDAATYELTDEPALTLEEEAAIKKLTANRAPVRQRSVYLSDLFGTGSLLITLASLLDHTSDPDGDALVVEGLTVSSGALEQTDEGYLYTPDPQYAGVVQFDYQISDGEAAITQTAHLNIKPTNVIGTDAKDNLTGHEGVDFIYAKDGDDTISAKAGGDLIYGSKGDDVIFGGEGDDEIFGGEGNDVLFGDGGDDRISGGADNDKVYGGTGSDILWGDAGQDELHGGSGSDLIYGGSGNDLILDGQDSDVAYGGSSSDTFRASMDRADDEYHGDDTGPAQQGIDVLDYSDAATALRVDIGAGTVDGAETGHDTFDGMEVVLAGSGDDEITGSMRGDIVEDGAGHDHVALGAGSDTVRVSIDQHEDNFDGGVGQDTIDLSGHVGDLVVDMVGNTISGPAIATDTATSFENVIGGHGNDKIIDADDKGENAFDGGDGFDTLDLTSQTQNLRVNVSAGTIASDGAATDTMTGIEHIVTGSGDDTFITSGKDGGHSLDAGDGDDTLDLSGHDSDLVVDLGAGTVSGPDVGSDQISGFENVVGGRGNDKIVVKQDDASHSYDGGEGHDTLDLKADAQDLRVDVTSGKISRADGLTDSFDGIESIETGSGDDVFVSTVGEGHKKYSGGEGKDTLDLSKDTKALKVDLREHKVEDEDGDQDDFEDIEAFFGTDEDDVFVVSNHGHEMTGGKGNDLYMFAHHEDDYDTAATINDFAVGDVIETRMFKFFERGEDNAGAGLQLGVGELVDTLNMSRVNFSYETHDDGEYTRLEVHEHDEYGTVITLQGHHIIFLIDAH